MIKVTAIQTGTVQIKAAQATGKPGRSALGRKICKSASHLTPNRLPTLTPLMALEVIAAAKEKSQWLGSRLDADRGESSQPIHTRRSLRAAHGLHLTLDPNHEY